MLVSLIVYSFNTQNEQWDEATIDPNIAKDSIYKELNQHVEILWPDTKRDTSIRKTNNVAYFSGTKIDYAKDKFYSHARCSAYFVNGTLMIDIGVNSGLDGYGVTIKYHDSRLYTQPYEWDDIISENEEEPMYKIIYQKLILNKSEYDIGDSLYGRVEFKIIEKNKYSGRREHLGKGNFRAKILKDQFSL